MTDDYIEYEKEIKTLKSINLDDLSVSDLTIYIEQLKNEINRVETEIVKKTKVVTTNKFSNPKGDIKRMGSDLENIKMNSWMSDKSITNANYKELGEKLAKIGAPW